MKNLFTLYNDLLDETGLIYKPSHIFNADESGVDLNSNARMVVDATKSKHTYTEQKSLRDHVTTLVCCSEQRLVLSPMIMFENFWPSRLYSKNGPQGLSICKISKWLYRRGIVPGMVQEDMFQKQSICHQLSSPLMGMVPTG